MNTCYVVKGFVNGKCCLSVIYQRKGNARKSYEKRVNSCCYDKVQLVLQNIVYFDDTALVLQEWENKN